MPPRPWAPARSSPSRRAAATALLLATAAVAAHAADAPDLCRATAAQAPSAPRAGLLVAEARAQHRRFGGQRIDTAGRLVRAGHGEAEFDRNPGDTEPTWRQVQRFWQAWSPDEPARVRDSHGRFQRTDLLRQAVRAAGTARLNSFGGDLRDLGLSAQEADALDTSVLRAALVDTPWSAVFVSYLVRSAGYDAREFRFSDAHADYARAALATGHRETDGRADPGAYRACDPATTAPRPGDLLCSTRARAAVLDSFDALAPALEAGGPLPMHCDLVVAVDAAALQAEAIGGNVLQSVTLRELRLQPAPTPGAPPLLDPAYRARAAAADAGFNDQPWVLLLQLR